MVTKQEVREYKWYENGINNVLNLKLMQFVQLCSNIVSIYKRIFFILKFSERGFELTLCLLLRGNMNVKI